MNKLKLIGLCIIAQVAVIVGPVRLMGTLMTGNDKQTVEILKGYDRLGNAELNGQSKETISSRAARGASEGTPWACHLCEFLDTIDPKHCERSAGI